MFNCKFCDKENTSKRCKGQHERFCKNNSLRKEYISYTTSKRGYNAWNKGLNQLIDDRVKQNVVSMKKSSHLIGWCKDPIKEVERRRKISVKAKLNGAGGYKENAGRSKKYKVYDSFGNKTTLQSSYEHDCFEILSELEIRWIRPKAFKYDGKNYFADFHLVDFDIWLDPKNNYKAKCDSEKIKKVIDQNKIKLLVLRKSQITKEYISRVVQW